MHVILDAKYLGEKNSAHEYLKKVFGFPEYYGKNLDALYDCLSEMSNLHIHIIHVEEAGDYYEKVLSVFEDLEDAEIIA